MSSKKKCNLKFCKRYTKRMMKNHIKFYDIYIDRDANKKLTKMERDEKKKVYDKEMSKKSKDKYHKKLVRECELIYCNPTCEGTIFESGKKLSDKFIKSINPKRVKDMIKTRKEIFGNKTNVLIDGYYEKEINSKYSRKNRREGAISYCSL